MSDLDKQGNPASTHRIRGYAYWAAFGFLLIAGYFLLTEHRAHTINYLPYALLLLCPLMHLFHNHGGHHSDPAGNTPAASDKEHGHA